jgi:peptidoglycan/xylan/chitin deacetylase (PgdA/CDA1 family)
MCDRGKRRHFSPNRLLEITPEFLDRVLSYVRNSGFEIISLDDAILRLQEGRGGQPKRLAKPFAVFTSDDGYKDNRDFAQPIFQKYQAPWTMFITSGFAEATAPLWWLDLEEAVAHLDQLEWVDAWGNDYRFPACYPDEKLKSANIYTGIFEMDLKSIYVP